MKNITKKELNRIAKKYGYDPQYLEDQVLDPGGCTGPRRLLRKRRHLKQNSPSGGRRGCCHN